MADDQTLSLIVDRIRRALDSEIEFIVLFGSRATGHELPQSDIDIAVKTSLPEDAWPATQLELAGLFDPDGQPPVGGVLLDAASLTMQYRVVRDGQVLYSSDPEHWDRFVEYVLVRYPDWAIYLNRYLEQSLG